MSKWKGDICEKIKGDGLMFLGRVGEMLLHTPAGQTDPRAFLFLSLKHTYTNICFICTLKLHMTFAFFSISI